MSAPFLPLYVGDYLRDTRGLTAEQHGAYLLLLMSMWSAGGRLPNDDRKLARFASCTPSRWAKIRGDVLSFFEVHEAEIGHVRLGSELEKAQEKSIKRAEAGSKGGQAKALKDKVLGVANAMPEPCHSSEPEPEKKRTPTDVGVERARAPKPKTGRASRLAPDWRPSPETWSKLKEAHRASDGELERELVKARNWSASAANGAKVNHEAFFANWCLTAEEGGKFGRAPPGGPPNILDVDPRTGDLLDARQPSRQDRSYPGNRPSSPRDFDPVLAGVASAFGRRAHG
ncbi:DUF1376 domain-containing protein [Methylopila sp. 73B]|uniref:YdaU family protein n=1 Tax=Methylopila sp. 73B TaxID=1120792 RepID=UPI0009DE7414|nr:DUF1376 domain-containing protein [Methylopila sp. 73B]